MCKMFYFFVASLFYTSNEEEAPKVFFSILIIQLNIRLLAMNKCGAISFITYAISMAWIAKKLFVGVRFEIDMKLLTISVEDTRAQSIHWTLSKQFLRRFLKTSKIDFIKPCNGSNNEIYNKFVCQNTKSFNFKT